MLGSFDSANKKMPGKDRPNPAVINGGKLNFLHTQQCQRLAALAPIDNYFALYENHHLQSRGNSVVVASQGRFLFRGREVYSLAEGTFGE